MSKNFHCNLLRKANNDRWLELKAVCHIIISADTITFRNVDTSLIMADFKNQNIQLELFGKNVIKVVLGYSNEPCLAFKLIDSESISEFKRVIHNCGIHFTNSNETNSSISNDTLSHTGVHLQQQQQQSQTATSSSHSSSPFMPNLHNEETQQFILTLLFNDSFHQFVNDLETLLEDFDHTINSSSHSHKTSSRNG